MDSFVDIQWILNCFIVVSVLTVIIGLIIPGVPDPLSLAERSGIPIDDGRGDHPEWVHSLPICVKCGYSRGTRYGAFFHPAEESFYCFDCIIPIGCTVKKLRRVKKWIDENNCEYYYWDDTNIRFDIHSSSDVSNLLCITVDAMTVRNRLVRRGLYSLEGADIQTRAWLNILSRQSDCFSLREHLRADNQYDRMWEDRARPKTNQLALFVRESILFRRNEDMREMLCKIEKHFFPDETGNDPCG